MGTFLSQLPTTGVQLVCLDTSYRCGLNNISDERHKINNPAGVTLKDLALYMQKDQGKIKWANGWYPLYAGILESGDKDKDAADKKRGRITV
jgi:hypothetical protein